MPKLSCTNDNNSPDTEVFFELNLKEKFTVNPFLETDFKKANHELKQDQIWQRYEIKLKAAENELYFNSNDKAANEVKGLFCFNLSPHNEIKQLSSDLENFLDNDEKEFIFEPLEPSIELKITKSHASLFKVELWIDSGNTSSIIYTWDALGIRFMTEKEKLKQFIEALKEKDYH